MTSPTATSPNQEPTLLGIKTCHETIFPNHKKEGPGIRTFNEWRARGYYPHVKIGKRVFLDPLQVRKALDKRFTIDAI